jgi:putative spermidine/putrescine transport system permease protein
MSPARLHPLLLGYAIFLAFVLVAPTLIVALMSFSAGVLLRFPPQGFSWRWYGYFLGADTWTRSIETSAEVGAATVIAIGLYFMFVRLHLVGTYSGMIAAHTALALPYVVVVVSSSLRNFDRTLERAANSLGAGPVRTFFKVTLPLILPSVGAGALFAFITSWDELIVAYFLSTPAVRTLPVVMWGAAQDTTDPTLAAVATFLSVITVAFLLIARLLGYRTRAA